jgi:PIN domain nuclease of toxin-antitoxin system
VRVLLDTHAFLWIAGDWKRGKTSLDATRDHALDVFSLPPHHADPFDRMIVAQAELEDLTVATRDRIFGRYHVRLLLA